MRIGRRFLAATTIAFALATFTFDALAAETIRIGEINSYSRLPVFSQPYRNGWELAVEEINAAGGVLGKQLEVVSRDDSGKPDDAIEAAGELVSRDEVVMLAGANLSHIGLAMADFARSRKVMFLAAGSLSDALTWSNGNHYTFRLRASTTMQAAILAEEAAKLGKKRWATIATNHKYGQDAVAAFRSELVKRQPGVEFIAEQWLAFGTADPGNDVEALLSANPDAIFNATRSGDLARFVRAGKQGKLFEGRLVVSLLSGEPEYLDPLKGDAPEGWIVTGYPWYAIDTPEHRAFVNAYRAKFSDYPRLGSVIGYNTFKAIAAIIEKAGSTDTEKMIAAAESISVESPTGPFTFRKADHQGTMGTYIGKTALKDGKGIMVDWRYVDGKDYLPSAEEVKKLRGN